MTSSVPDTLTLAQFVQVARAAVGITQQRLADQAHLPLALIQDLENGLELFLAPAVRQKLARVLKVRPQQIKALEKELTGGTFVYSEAARERYREEILHFPDADHLCPQCQACMHTRIFYRRDLEDNPLVEVKAHCSQCLFKL